MYKFNDTEIVDQVNLSSGAYALAHSEQCAARYGEGYTLRHYPGQQDVHPYMDQHEASIDFKDLDDALKGIDSFPDEDTERLIVWLSANVV